MTEEKTVPETAVQDTPKAETPKETTAAANETTNERGNTRGRDASRGPQGRRGPNSNNRRGGGNDRRRGGGGPRGRGRGRERVKPEFEQKMIAIRRVTRVMAGGRRFNFSVAMVIGDRKGRVGVGIGKAGDTQLAIEKAIRDARKNMITIPMDKHSRIAHDVQKKVASSVVMIKPAPGRGVVAGSAVRTVLELGGVKDVTAKILSRSKNNLNNARATIEAIKLLK